MAKQILVTLGLVLAIFGMASAQSPEAWLGKQATNTKLEDFVFVFRDLPSETQRELLSYLTDSSPIVDRGVDNLSYLIERLRDTGLRRDEVPYRRASALGNALSAADQMFLEVFGKGDPTHYMLHHDSFGVWGAYTKCGLT